MRGLGHFISTAGYLGYSPLAPGTVGSAVGLVVMLVVRSASGPLVEVAAVLLVSALAVWSAHVTERELGQEDPSVVVIDEVAGMMVTVLGIPLNWLNAIVGFAVFRVFDIIKPFPARRAERLTGGIGIVADDLIAGLYAAIVVRGLDWLVGSVGAR